LAKEVEGRSLRTLEWYQEALEAFERFCSCQGFDPDPLRLPPALEYLITSAGADKVLMGTDYPYDMADSQPVLTVQNLENISEEAKQLVWGGNATRIFKL